MMFSRVSESLILVESAGQSHLSQIVVGLSGATGIPLLANTRTTAVFLPHGIYVRAIALVLRLSTTGKGLAAESKIYNIANMISSRQDTSSPFAMRLLISMT